MTLVKIGLLLGFLGMPACIATGALLWEVSPFFSRLVGLYGSLAFFLTTIVILIIQLWRRRVTFYLADGALVYGSQVNRRNQGSN